MRQRKFRGKAIDDSRFYNKGEWVYGWGCKDLTEDQSEVIVIVTTQDSEETKYDIEVTIEPVTLGDFVFLDIKEEDVYEGDLVQSDRYYFDKSYYGIVCYDEESCSYYVEARVRSSSSVKGISSGISSPIDEYKWEKVGNIFDNKELIRTELL
jgi:hypothetical protein